MWYVIIPQVCCEERKIDLIFKLNIKEVITATIDIEDVRSHRSISSRGMQATNTPRYKRIEAPIVLSQSMLNNKILFRLTKPIKEFYHIPEQEIA